MIRHDSRISDIVDECPVCGRPVRIPWRYIGRRVRCCHCGGSFAVTEHGVQTPAYAIKCERLLSLDRVPRQIGGATRSRLLARESRWKIGSR